MIKHNTPINKEITINIRHVHDLLVLSAMINRSRNQIKEQVNALIEDHFNMFEKYDKHSEAPWIEDDIYYQLFHMIDKVIAQENSTKNQSKTKSEVVEFKRFIRPQSQKNDTVSNLGGISFHFHLNYKTRVAKVYYTICSPEDNFERNYIDSNKKFHQRIVLSIDELYNAADKHRGVVNGLLNIISSNKCRSIQHKKLLESALAITKNNMDILTKLTPE